MPGPKRTPTALKLLRGNPSGKALNLDEPQPDALEPACPADLHDDRARAEWARAIAPAIRIGQITAADRALALAHCELWAQWQALLVEAATQPAIVTCGKNAYRVPNPVRVLANKTLHLLGQVDEKLGFTPTSRSKIAIKGPGSIRSTLDKRRAKFFALSRG